MACLSHLDTHYLVSLAHLQLPLHNLFLAFSIGLRLNKGAQERVCGMRPCPEVSCQGWKTGSLERRTLEEAEEQTWKRGMTVPEAPSHLSWVSGSPRHPGKMSSLSQAWPVMNLMAVPLYLGLY